MNPYVAYAVVSAWNQQYPVGHPVIYCRNAGLITKSISTRTRTEAIVDDGEAVIHIVGVKAPVLLSYLIPVNEQTETKRLPQGLAPLRMTLQLVEAP